MSVNASTSSAAEPITFWVSMRIPSRAVSWQLGTFGTPSTRSRQPSQRPTKHCGPRGRWYFTLRPKSQRPEATSAVATFSPDSARTFFPSTRRVTTSRSGSMRRALIAGTLQWFAARLRAPPWPLSRSHGKLSPMRDTEPI